MRLRFLLPIVFLLSVNFGFAQNQTTLEFANQKLEERGEFFFHFNCEDTEILQELNQLLWIDKVDGSTIYAYATTATFPQFLTYGIKFSPVESYYDTSKALTMATTTAQMANWDRYPTHAVYLQMLDDFATNYPDLCEVEIIGYSENGVPIKTLIISDNVGTDEDEPEFWWSGTMHGDELAGYTILLRFADYLLSNYGTDAQVTNLVNEMEIFINPLANPDGTFNNSSGLDNVAQSIRANSNGIDLNRNFPTLDGSGYTLQDEITCMMDYATNHDFVMSANTHGGIELINHPWDAWQSWENLHPDNDWWVHVCFVYADQVEIDAPVSYFEGPGNMNYGSYNDSGVTHGADWYYAIGSRQDYMNYYQNCREVTIEWSDTKQLGTEYLDDYWNYNKQAMLDYTEQALFGLRGIVTDACTGNPLSDVKVEIVGHDQDNTEVYSSAPVGNYHRPIYAGTYDFTFALAGYHTQTHTVTIANDNALRLDIELIPDIVASPDFSADQTSVFTGTNIQFTDLSTGTVDSYDWTLTGGNPNSSANQNPSSTYYTAGVYDVNLEITSQGCTVSELKENYITVSAPAAPIADFEASATSVPLGETVDFTDLSANVPSTWEWTFEGGTPNTATDQNPSVVYNTAGTYEVTLVASNAYGDDTEIKTGYITVFLDYCDASQNDTDYMYVADFNLNTIANTTGATSYSDFTSLSTDLLAGDSYTFSVNAGAGYDYNQCIIWVDWNQDGDFEDAGEEIYRSAIENAVDYSTDITVPITANLGETRLRVKVHYNLNDYNPNDTPCGVGGYGEVEDYSINIISPDIPPTADFSAAQTTSCTGEIQFQDESSLATAWSWDFGDGNTSNEQHPLHTYTADGTYTVSLTVTNDYGSDDIIKTDYITIDMPDAPVIADAESCGADNITLAATAAGEINWYDAQTGGNFLASGNDYTNNFTATTTVYADNTLINSQYYSAGKADNTGDGGFFTATNQHGLIFDAYTDFVIESVRVYADGAADRTITLYDNTDAEIASTTVSIPDGESVVTLNFSVPAGTNYTLMGPGSPNLYRNGGAGNILPFPYELTDILSIHDNTAGNLEYYYYFYDWQVRIDETCVSSRTAATVTIHDIPTVDLGDDQAICDGDDFTFDAGSGFSSYTWTPTATDQSYVATTAGNYAVTVEDANGCTATDDVNLTVNPNPELSFTSTPATGTNSDGSITVNVISGDEAPLNYIWNTFPEQFTQTAVDLPAGNYCVTVSNGFGCITVGCGNISALNSAPIADFSADDTQGCGSLSVQFTDQSLNLPEAWNWDFGDGNTSTEQNPLHTFIAEGTYTVSLSVTNEFGDDEMIKTDHITVYDNVEIIGTDSELICYGDMNGELSVTVNGGSGVYNYLWENESGTSVGNTADISGLAAGTYYLSVTDDIGCEATDSYTIAQPDPLSLDFEVINESALSLCDGEITATANGGTIPYNYQWQTLSTSPMQSGLCPGTYHLTVTDDNGCTMSGSAEVLEGPELLTANFASNVTEGCENLTVQFTDLSVGIPVAWTWSFGDGETSDLQSPEHIYTEPGVYTVSLLVEDADSETNETIFTDYITVLDRPELDFEVTDESAALAADGEITVLITGTDFPYDIDWNTGDDTETISGLTAALYSVAVTGANGCAATGATQVQTLTSLFDNQTQQTILFPNPVKRDLFVEASGKVVSLQVLSIDGRVVLEMNPENTTFSLEMPATSGLYMLVLDYESGISERFPVVVE
jgi:PKD repeat protein